jgi:L-fuculose-phosphate aldolase
MLSQFQAIGQALFTQGLVSSSSGNLSVRNGDNLIITHRGCDLCSIDDADLVETGIFKNSRATPFASSELAVHRSVYRKTRAQTIVHAHPVYSVVLSLLLREIVPRDLEGRQVLERVPVVGEEAAVKPGQLGQEIAEALKRVTVVLVRGHGSFAIGQMLAEAYYRTVVLERSCRILYLLSGCALHA